MKKNQPKTDSKTLGEKGIIITNTLNIIALFVWFGLVSLLFITPELFLNLSGNTAFVYREEPNFNDRIYEHIFYHDIPEKYRAGMSVFIIGTHEDELVFGLPLFSKEENVGWHSLNTIAVDKHADLREDIIVWHEVGHHYWNKLSSKTQREWKEYYNETSVFLNAHMSSSVEEYYADSFACYHLEYLDSVIYDLNGTRELELDETQRWQSSKDQGAYYYKNESYNCLKYIKEIELWVTLYE